MRIKLGLVFIIFFVILSSFSLAEINAESPTRLFIRAKNFYGLGDYDGAISSYEKILSQGFENGNLYYNLGNAYFKKGELGKAIANYERARGLMPRDSDLKANYNFALSQVINNFTPEQKPLIGRVADKYASKFTINEMCIILLVLYMALIFFIILRLYVYSLRQYVAFFVSPIVLIMLINIFALVPQVKKMNKTAVVVIESIDSRFEPLEAATSHFRLFEGAKVLILQERSNWYKIERLDKKAGWVEAMALEII